MEQRTNWTRIEIEDVSDCEACTQRNKEYGITYLAEVRIKCIGLAWCSECGRKYEAITADDLPDEVDHQ